MGLVVGPAPVTFGGCSLVAAMELVCLIHLAICIFFVAHVTSERSMLVAGVEVSPIVQCSIGAWFLAGIPVVIYGGVGAAFLVDHHLSAYLLYLVGTLTMAVAWASWFVAYGNSCTVPEGEEANWYNYYEDRPRQPGLWCGVSNAMVLFWLCAFAGAILWAIYLAWSMKSHAASRAEAEMLRHQEPWQIAQAMAEEALAEQARNDFDVRQKLAGLHGLGGSYGSPAAFGAHHHPTSFGPAAPAY